MIKVENIHYSYGKLKVLKGVSLNITKGEFVSVIGESGAGKTTLLHLLGGLEKIQEGYIEINNRKIKNLSKDELSIFRNQEVGFIFQSHNLLIEFTALENIILPSLIRGDSKSEAISKALDLLNILGIHNRKNHKPNELSGGEQQRVAVARALINNPSIVLADEPSGNLDSKNAEELHNLFRKLNKEFNQTFIIITHNKTLAKLADRNIEIRDGKIITNKGKSKNASNYQKDINWSKIKK